jgi:hypothetical protein
VTEEQGIMTKKLNKASKKLLNIESRDLNKEGDKTSPSHLKVSD